jgi:hypothetical protein
MSETEAQIAAQGEKIRQLKAAKAAKDAIEPEVKILLALKAKYKVNTKTRKRFSYMSSRSLHPFIIKTAFVCSNFVIFVIFCYLVVI